MLSSLTQNMVFFPRQYLVINIIRSSNFTTDITVIFIE